MILPFFVILTISDANINAIVGWATELVANLMPLLIVIIGIAIGAFVIKVILHIKD